ncbi:NAD-dependent epimerase/dehydratase family protein [soil metagenome]
MAKTLVTGGTGFIGSHVVKQLAARGDDLRLLVREGRDTSHLDDLDWERAEGDVTDRASVRLATDDVSRVFHIAGTTSMRASDRDRVFAVNVGGTRIVMEEALRAGVLRVVHTSSCSAVGTAPPNGTIDETEPFKIGHLGIAYVNSKHDAETEAMRAAARGLPVVVVNPAFVLGPDDPTGTSNRLVSRLLLRRVPAYLDGGLNIVDVRDVAAGHLLADERGEEGERYLLAGRNFTIQRLFADLSRIAGVPQPPVRASGHLATLVVEALAKTGIPMPVNADEVRSATKWWTYSNEKAARGLGWHPRPHEETLADTVAWQLERLGPRARGHALADAGLRASGTAARLVPFGLAR